MKYIAPIFKNPVTPITFYKPAPLKNTLLKCFFCGLGLLLWTGQTVWADGRLIVSVFPSPPCVFHKNQEPISGFSVDLLNAVAAQEKLKVEYLPNPLDLAAFEKDPKAIQNNLLHSDLIVGCIRETAQRESLYDFIHVLSTGYKALVKKQVSFFATYSEVIKTLGAYAVVVLLSGLLMVWLERRGKNTNVKTACDGVYLSHAIATTVGFGDLYPVTRKGRALFFVVSVVGVLLFGNIISDLSLIKIKSEGKYNLEHAVELKKHSVGALQDSSAYDYLRDLGIKPKVFADFQKMYQSLIHEKVDVLFGNELLLLYLASQHSEAVLTSHKTFHPHTYGWIVSPVLGKATEEKIKSGLLKLHENGDFEKIYRRWFY